MTTRMVSARVDRDRRGGGAPGRVARSIGLAAFAAIALRPVAGGGAGGAEVERQPGFLARLRGGGAAAEADGRAGAMCGERSRLRAAAFHARVPYLNAPAALCAGSAGAEKLHLPIAFRGVARGGGRGLER